MTTSLELRLTQNQLAALALQKCVEALQAERLTPVGDGSGQRYDLWADYDDAAQDLHRTVMDVVLEAPCGTTIHTADGPLIVNHRAGLVDGGFYQGVADRVTLTEDGEAAFSAWHADGESETSVRFERYSLAGRVSHGYVDAVSRKMTQTG